MTSHVGNFFPEDYQAGDDGSIFRKGRFRLSMVLFVVMFFPVITVDLWGLGWSLPTTYDEKFTLLPWFPLSDSMFE